MKILFYSTKNFERPFLDAANTGTHELGFTAASLSADTVDLSKDYECVSIFTNDDGSEPILQRLHQHGIRHIAIRAAGYDNVDLGAAAKYGISVANVPEYSPYAIAEHTVAMMLAMNRQLIVASEQVRRYDFTLDRLVGFDFNKKCIGVIGTGKIGAIVAGIMKGFGCRILAYDINPSKELQRQHGVEYTGLERLCRESDVVTLHTPLNSATKYMIDSRLLREMKQGVMLVNTSRGALVNTADLLEYLRNGHVGYYAMDVYENERGVFFYDHSSAGISDPVLKDLLEMRNVLTTPHQAFATREALGNIADTTLYNISRWAGKNKSENELY